MIFTSNTLLERKNRAATALNRVLDNDSALLVVSGEPIQKPGGHDQTYPFLPHPDYFWLTGLRRPFGVSVYSKDEGWVDFVLHVTREEKIWEGGQEIINGRPIEELKAWFGQKKISKIFLLGQWDKYKDLSTVSDESQAIIAETFHEVRRIKDPQEIELVTSLAQIASQGYKKLQEFIRPGVSEREIQLAYEGEVLKHGSEKMPYESIVGTGTNAAILHAIPTPRIVKDGEMVLIDAGADIQDYCVDITRVYAANGKFTEQQKTIYNLVKDAQAQSIALMRPGVEWKDIHLTSARVMAQGLIDLGIIRGSADASLETGSISVFFPHGVGHMVGLRVRDVGGKPNPNPKKYAGARLRVDMPLSEGYLMTVEPGLYFIKALLEDLETRSLYKDHINWTEVEKWKDFGGVRLEDDIHVTKDGPVNLTAMISK